MALVFPCFRNTRPRRRTYSRVPALPPRITAIFGFGHINALIQNQGGHHGPVNAALESAQNGLALGSLSLMSDERDNLVPGNAIRLVFLRELGMSAFGYCPSGLNDDLFLSAKEAQSILKYRPSL